MEKMNTIKAKYIARLISTGSYDMDELKVMPLVELRKLMDKEFPIVIKGISVTASGGVRRTSTIIKRRG